MNKLVIGFLFITTSCNQNTVENKAVPQKDITNKVDSVDKSEEILNNKRPEAFSESIQTIPVELKSFMLPGYNLIRLSSGDANLDGSTDWIMVFEKYIKTAEDEQEDRPMLLLIAQSDKTFKLDYRNDKAVNCLSCGGIFGDPFINIIIKKGYFSIEHGQAGGSQHWNQITTFKYDRGKENWFLYKDHFISYKLNDSVDENAEALVIDVDKLKTVKDFGVVPFSAFNIYNERGY